MESPDDVAVYAYMNYSISNTSDPSLHLAYLDYEPSENFVLKQTPYMILVFSVAYLLIFLCALVGNTMVVMVVIKTPRMRNVTNYLIANLAVADILVAIFCIPLTLLDNIFSGKSIVVIF